MTQLQITINVIKTIYELRSVILAKGLQEVCLNKERGLSLELKKIHVYRSQTQQIRRQP